MDRVVIKEKISKLFYKHLAKLSKKYFDTCSTASNFIKITLINQLTDSANSLS